MYNINIKPTTRRNSNEPWKQKRVLSIILGVYWGNLYKYGWLVFPILGGWISSRDLTNLPPNWRKKKLGCFFRTEEQHFLSLSSVLMFFWNMPHPKRTNQQTYVKKCKKNIPNVFLVKAWQMVGVKTCLETTWIMWWLVIHQKKYNYSKLNFAEPTCTYICNETVLAWLISFWSWACLKITYQSDAGSGGRSRWQVSVSRDRNFGPERKDPYCENNVSIDWYKGLTMFVVYWYTVWKGNV